MSLPSSCHDERAVSVSRRDLPEFASTSARYAATAVMDIRARGITINRKPDASIIRSLRCASPWRVISA